MKRIRNSQFTNKKIKTHESGDFGMVSCLLCPVYYNVKMIFVFIHIPMITSRGAIDHRGNKTPAAEANFVNDPEAARVVMDAFPNITLAGLNVTHSVHTQDWFLHELRSNCGHLGTISDCMLKHYIRASQLYGSGGVHMHDSTAIMAIIRPDLFTTQRTRVQVETKVKQAWRERKRGHIQLK